MENLIDREAYIVDFKRSPMTGMNGELHTLTAPDLGAHAIKAVLESAKIDPAQVDELFMGNVLQANVGQAPARQAGIKAGLPNKVPCTTINKVCASGMKSIMFAALQIQAGYSDLVVAGGMENMSKAPFMVDKARQGYGFGNDVLYDCMFRDGLSDPFSGSIMGLAAEKCAEVNRVTREDQDSFALESYRRSKESYEAGYFKGEIAPVEIPQRRGAPKIISEDDEYPKIMPDKIGKLRSPFKKDGSVTAANASVISDGAAAMVIASGKKCKELGLTPVARILGFGDGATEPFDFTIAPSIAVPVALQRANVEIKDVDYWELNEAFSVVGVENMRRLGIDASKCNIHGGAVSLGHPLGVSGTRIVGTLCRTLKEKNAKIGVAGICNGGGGASAIVVENLM